MYTLNRIVVDGFFCIEHVCDITLERKIIFRSESEIENMRRFKRMIELRDYEMSLWRKFWR